MNDINSLYASLGKEEIYDSSSLAVWPYKKVNDIIEGIQVNLSNMAGGFPFVSNNTTWKNNEVLYLCGEFSYNTDEYFKIQEELINTTSGFAAKRFVKSKYLDEVRPDFFDFRLDWMLYVVWEKCKGNEDFRKKLLSIPENVILVEETTTDKGGTANIWGCSNPELVQMRKERETELRNTLQNLKKKELENIISVEINKIRDIGVYKGQNNMGKILHICKKCIEQNVEPPLNKELLNSKNIFILGKQIII